MKEWMSDMKGLKGTFGICLDMNGKDFDLLDRRFVYAVGGYTGGMWDICNPRRTMGTVHLQGTSAGQPSERKHKDLVRVALNVKHFFTLYGK